MKLKERKGNKSEKEVKPVKKSVALVLTIVTVFAFAAACFSLGFCSGKKVNEAYAAKDYHSGGVSEFVSSSGNYLYSKTSVKTKLSFSGTFGNTWTPITFTGLRSFTGSNVWYANSSIYASSTASTKYQVQYVNDSWSTVTWTGLQPTGSNIFSWHGNTYHFYNNTCYILNGSTWVPVLMDGLSSVLASYFWTDGEKLFCSTGSANYVLDSSSTPTIFNWNVISWTGTTALRGSGVWSDGTNIYFSSGNNQYILDTSDYSATPVTWSGLSSFSASSIWSDGTNIYYSAGASSQYVLDVDSRTWNKMVWKGTSILYGSSFWTDGINIYYSNGSSSYVLDRQDETFYTCTLSENASGMYSFGYIEGEGVTYNHESGTMEGPADSTFQVQLMPFEGYMVDTFLLTASYGYAKSIVKNSDTLYTITFGSEDFTLNISASVKIIEYTLTCEYEGEQNYSITYGMTGEITRNGNIFTGKPGASVYVRITPNDGYIMRSLSYQITDGEVLSVTPGSSNNYTIVLTSSNATILFSVVATAATVDISSGYYWIQCRNYGTDFSELTLQSGQFQIVESVSGSGIVWQDLTGLVCGAGKLSFRLPGDKRISVYTVTETHDDFSLSSGVVISDQGNIVAGHDYDYYSTLWAANWYPVIYVPSNIMEDEVSDILVSFFKSSSVYKADPVYYNGFYLTKKDTIANSNAFYNTYLGIYVPVANTLVSPSSVSFIPDSGGVSNITYKSALNFMGDVSSGEYAIYCGYDYNYNSTVSYNRVGRIPPAPRPGTYMESIYIYPTIMPERLYNLMARWFDIASGPVVPDPPPSSYWEGLDEVLSYEIFGIPLSSLLAIVISSVFVVVVIRLFAGG